MSKLHVLPCLDSDSMAASRRQELNIPRDVAAALGRSAGEAARAGLYVTRTGQEVVWRDAVQAACAAKLSIAPDSTLPSNDRIAFTETRAQVTNETTLGASLRLVERGLRPLALNFANGVVPGGASLVEPERRRRRFVDPALSIRHWSAIRCMRSTESGNYRILLIGQSIHLTFPSFEWMTERSFNIRGY